MDGSFLKYLPKNDRINFLEKNNCRIILNNERKKKNNKNQELLFILSRYQHIYGINILSDEISFDKTLISDQYIQGVEKNQFSSYKLEKSGIPLPYIVIYKLINTGILDKRFEGIDLSRIIYIFSQEKQQTKTLIFNHIIKEYHIFFRILESGAMIKTSQPVVKTSRLLLHRKQNHQEFEIDLEETNRLINAFIEKTDGFIQHFFSQLSKYAQLDPKIQSLSNLIVKTINSYNCMNVKSSTVSEMSSTGSKHPSKVQKTRNMKDKTKPIQTPCCVSGCSLIRRTNDMNTPVIFIYLYKTVKDFKMVKKSEKKYDLSLRLCEEHGYLLSTVWYLFNQMKIWSYNILNGTKCFKYEKYGSSMQSMYSSYVLSTHNMLKEREKMDLSILYIKQWMENQSLSE